MTVALVSLSAAVLGAVIIIGLLVRHILRYDPVEHMVDLGKKYVAEKNRADLTSLKLTAAEQERDNANLTIAQRDNEIASLSDRLAKEKRNALASSSDDDLLRRGNGEL